MLPRPVVHTVVAPAPSRGLQLADTRALVAVASRICPDAGVCETLGTMSTTTVRTDNSTYLL